MSMSDPQPDWSYLKYLEAEAIYILREAASQFNNPFILFSGGKDSIVVTHLARKAFFPAPTPFTLLHIDTGHNFPETLQFRDYLSRKFSLKLEIAYVQDLIDSGNVEEEQGDHPSRNTAQIPTLLKAIKNYKIDACIGGARRDEEKARAKERIFSHRNAFGQWEPRNQRPELWKILNGKKKVGEHFRIFPISNWTELDVWRYIHHENIELPSLYFSHPRNCFMRNGVIYSESEFIQLRPEETLTKLNVRYRTIGDATITGAWVSEAKNTLEVIEEITHSRVTERGRREDDKRSVNAMEERKREGYF